jgi:hypothetical protein
MDKKLRCAKFAVSAQSVPVDMQKLIHMRDHATSLDDLVSLLERSITVSER